jgi:hypothetical protein
MYYDQKGISMRVVGPWRVPRFRAATFPGNLGGEMETRKSSFGASSRKNTRRPPRIECIERIIWYYLERRKRMEPSAVTVTVSERESVNIYFSTEHACACQASHSPGWEYLPLDISICLAWFAGGLSERGFVVKLVPLRGSWPHGVWYQSFC